ncbi:hypothetical protein ACH5RR_000885 [Cinchona calisaya]|uniref:Uncharacterized protein n=1 Tax=Cinchona calisaya TaxID=153742 RepID=A0ABD3B218_9GENT
MRGRGEGKEMAEIDLLTKEEGYLGGGRGWICEGGAGDEEEMEAKNLWRRGAVWKEGEGKTCEKPSWRMSPIALLQTYGRKPNINWHLLDSESNSIGDGKSGGVLVMWDDSVSNIEVVEHGNYLSCLFHNPTGTDPWVFTSFYADCTTGIDKTRVLKSAKKVCSSGMGNKPWCITGNFNLHMEGMKSTIILDSTIKKDLTKSSIKNSWLGLHWKSFQSLVETTHIRHPYSKSLKNLLDRFKERGIDVERFYIRSEGAFEKAKGYNKNEGLVDQCVFSDENLSPFPVGYLPVVEIISGDASKFEDGATARKPIQEEYDFMHGDPKYRKFLLEYWNKYSNEIAARIEIFSEKDHGKRSFHSVKPAVGKAKLYKQKGLVAESEFVKASWGTLLMVSGM